MKRIIFLLGLLFPVILFSQTQSLWSKDSIKYSTSIQVYASQYTSPLYAIPNEFYFSDTLKKSNPYVAVNTWLVKDFNQDGYSDIFLGFFTGGELEKIPFKMFLDDEVHSIYIRYMGKEVIKTRYGKFRAIKFKPMLISGTIFEGGELMSVWVSDDGNHVPLRIESPITVGSIKVDMMGYRNLRYPMQSMISFK